jgi:folate-binding protein YgfZ
MNEVEYSTIRDGGAGVCDLSYRGRIEISGKNAPQFLNGYVTNDVAKLENLQWIPAAFPTVQGRLLGVARILKVNDKFLLDTDIEAAPLILKTLEKFTLAGDFFISDITTSCSHLTIQGRDSSRIVSHIRDDLQDLQKGHVARLDNGVVIRNTHTGEHGYDFFIYSDRETILKLLTEHGALMVDQNTLEVLRIEAGIPLFGKDMDDSLVVLETGLDEYVSYTKGCYIGQEIIARIHWRGHVARKLTGLLFDQKADVRSDLKLSSTDGKPAGRVTSVTYSPKLDRTIAIGLIRYEFLKPSTELITEDGITARVTELPFVSGSWNV